MADNRVSRRSFLTVTASGLGVAALAAPELAQGEPKPPAAGPAPTELRPKKLNKPGEIVQVHHGQAMKNMAKIDGSVVGQMVDRGVMELTGKADLAAAWGEIVYPDDVVEIKINTLGKRHNSTNGETVEAIIRGLQAAGVPRERVIIYDMYGGHMLSTGYSMFRPDNKLVAFGDTWGYEKNRTVHGGGKSTFAQVLNRVTAIINVPVMKDHALTHITGAIKNMTHGHIKEPGDFHAAGGPNLPHIYAVPRIRDKVRLIVMDGLRLLYNGGPQDNPRHKVVNNTLYFTTDPIAIDTILYERIQEHRQNAKLKPLPLPKMLPVGQELGLGVHDRSKINLRLVELMADPPPAPPEPAKKG